MYKRSLFLLFFILFVFLLSMMSCVSTRTKEEDLPYDSISQYIAMGEPEKAVEEYEKAQKEGKDESILKILYARLLLLAGRTEDAKRELLLVIEKEKENLDALFSLAIAYGTEGNREKQVEILEQILKIDESHESALSYLGEFYLEENKTDKAAGYFNRALKKNPDNFISLIGLAHAMMRQKEYEKAIELYNRAVSIDPDYSFAYIDRANAKKQLKDMTGAINDLTQAISIDPDYYWSFIDRGNLYIKTGKTDLATGDFSEAIEIDPDYFIAYVYLGGVYYAQKNWEKARQNYEKVYELKPKYFHIYESLGVIYYMEEKWDQAIDMFKKAYEYNKNGLSYLLLTAICYKKDNRDAEAKSLLNKKISAFPKETWYYDVARFYIFPDNDLAVNKRHGEEKNRIIKKQILFYISIQYLLNGETNPARTLLLEVTNLERKDLLEYDLARWELERLGGEIDW